MAIIKCKMCGGDLELLEDSSVCECEYCGTRQTVPKVDDEKKLKLFERANRLRTACEFDKAAGVYETIIADFDQEAEAYWGLILCKFGIEYVDDPATGKKIPTCHRSSFESLMDDPNFEMVMECADPIARRVYREEAKQIEELRKSIIEVSSREEPYDVFISYKELAEDGQRTLDSVIAQDIYTELTDKGYRVFFSRISLESKLGVEYEPYIFAALNSARVMLVVGTDYDYFNAVWVKNEWSRFLALMAKGEKKVLIPVFKGIDAYDMPKEFNKLAAQDMGKVGAMQDLIRGVEKIIGKKKPESAAQPQQIVQQVIQGGGPNVQSLLDRGNMALEDGDWDKAKDYFDQALNMDAKSGAAYLGLAMAEAKARDRSAYAAAYTAVESNIRDSRHAARARQFDPELEKWFAALDEQGRAADEEARIAREKKAEEEQLKRQAAIARLAAVRQRNAPAAEMLSAVSRHTVGLRADGTVVATGINNVGQCDVSGWRDVVAVSAGDYHTVGLRADGTVLATGSDYYGQCRVSGWRDVVAISAGGCIGSDCTVGLRADGTVLAAGANRDGQCDVNGWRDIVAVSAGRWHTVGLRADGTVVAAGSNSYGQSDVSDWSDVVAVSGGDAHTVGLRVDGTVIATGKNYEGQCDVSGWTDVVAISAGWDHTVGLRADGTVVAAGKNAAGQCDVSGWENVVAVSGGDAHTVGLRADGTVLAAGANRDGQCDVNGWKLFDSIDTVKVERKAAADKAMAERQAKVAALNGEKAQLQVEHANLKGLFTGKRRKEIEARLAEIEAELKKLG
jgi:alpha-tubulin suppressor-like RCC1 family protein/DNA-directed RNA polymerase subunit RPC12/RpoP